MMHDAGFRFARHRQSRTSLRISHARTIAQLCAQNTRTRRVGLSQLAPNMTLPQQTVGATGGSHRSSAIRASISPLTTSSVWSIRSWHELQCNMPNAPQWSGQHYRWQGQTQGRVRHTWRRANLRAKWTPGVGGIILDAAPPHRAGACLRLVLDVLACGLCTNRSPK